MAKNLTAAEASNVVKVTEGLQGGGRLAPLIDPRVQAEAARELGIIKEGVASQIAEAAETGGVKGYPTVSEMASGHSTVSSERKV